MIEKFREVIAKYPLVSKIVGWSVLVILGITATTIFFLSYSLARHKRIVADLRVQVIALDTKLKVAADEAKIQELKHRLDMLKADDDKIKQEREKIRQELTKTEASIAAAKKKLEEDLKKYPQRPLKELLAESKKLLQELL